MNFKPGDKVWIENHSGGDYPAGTYAGVLVEACSDCPITNLGISCGWWRTDIEGLSLPVGSLYHLAHESRMRRRYDPPDWVKLCELDSVPVVEELA